MYYGLILVSVAMFGIGFALQDVYRSMRGSGLRISLETSFVGSLAGLAVLLVVNGFRVEFTLFTFLIALLASLNSIAFAFCTIRSLDTINLSMFSLFSMLGGMVLPFLQGIIFYNEALTLAKILCLILIGAALAVTVTKGEKKKGAVYCVGLFILNGMSGVLAKIFSASPFEKTGNAGYSIWIAICTAAISGLLLLTLKNKTRKPYTWKALGVGASQGSINQIANFFLVVTIAYVDSSAQYPIVTGGVIIVSTLISFLGSRKPTKKEILSVVLAFVGTLVLFVIPV